MKEIITSAKEVMFLPDFVCLFVCFLVIFIKSHGSRFYSWLPLNLCLIFDVKEIEISVNVGGQKIKTSTGEIYV